MSIRQLGEKIKNIALPAKASAPTGEDFIFDKEGHIEERFSLKRFFLSIVIILVAGLSFGLGRLSVTGDREPVQIEFDPTLSSLSKPIEAGKSQTASVTNAVDNGQVVASTKGSKYHFLFCPGAKQISEANKVTFASAAAAEASGYTLASNCKPK